MKIEYAYQDQYPIGYATDGSAGIDLRFIDLEIKNDSGVIHCDNGEYRFESGLENTVSINTGVRVAIPKGYVGLFSVRSSMGAKGMVLSSLTGIIDSDYRGPLAAKVWFRKPMTIKRFERIVQLVIVPVLTVELEFTDSFDVSDTARGEGGWGSTNVNN